MSGDNVFVAAALKYADRGWYVLPVKAGGKNPLTAHGCNDATRDSEIIKEWGSKWPSANVGILTGRHSGLVVLDIDPGHGGTHGLKQLIDQHGILHDTLTCLTGGGGFHHYFAHPGDRLIKNATKLAGAPGVDLRGDGGYVVAPPSIHSSGHIYRWENANDADASLIAPLPDWLAKLSTRQSTAEPVRIEGRAIIREHVRNDTLFRLGCSMRGKGLSPGAIEAALLKHNAECCEPPLQANEVTRIARSVLTYPEGGLGPDRHLTDFGNARRLVLQHGRDMRFVRTLSDWLFFDARRWAKDETGEVARRAKATVRSIYGEAEREADPENRKDIAKHARRSESAGAIRAMMELASTEPEIAASSIDFDRDPWVLNVLNGTIDLRTGTLKRHTREGLLRNLAPVDFDPNAWCPVFEGFTTRIFPDSELRAFVQRAMGYTLVGEPSEGKLFLAHGPTASGKTTLLEASKAMLGDYARTASFDTFLARRDTGRPRPDLARLAGARLVTSSEVEPNQRLAEGLIKSITGGDLLTARFLYRRETEFVPQFTLWLAANDVPRARDDDDALWRRIERVPFNVSIPEGERDPAVKARLCRSPDSRAAILAWAVRGCLDWQAGGLQVPVSVRDSTASYRECQNPVLDFVDDCCETEEGVWTPTRMLYAAYLQWARDRRVPALSVKGFTGALARMGFQPHQETKGDRERGWWGLHLRDEQRM
jgi:putative DNA primase/helicase